MHQALELLAGEPPLLKGQIPLAASEKLEHQFRQDSMIDTVETPQGTAKSVYRHPRGHRWGPRPARPRWCKLIGSRRARR